MSDRATLAEKIAYWWLVFVGSAVACGFVAVYALLWAFHWPVAATLTVAVATFAAREMLK